MPDHFSWPYCTPGLPDRMFEELPGIPMTPRELRVLIVAQLRLQRDSILWDIGAGTGTIAVEAALLTDQGQVVAVERDDEVAVLIHRNGQRLGIENISVVVGTAPGCLDSLEPRPNRILIEGSRSLDNIVMAAWPYLRPQGRLVVTTTSLEGLYAVSQALSDLKAHQVEVVQAAINRLEQRGNSQSLVALNPLFVLSGEKPD
jgi:cobalt-precorrin-6B (C15)-methyltransferase